jgi:hypothetical protein
VWPKRQRKKVDCQNTNYEHGPSVNPTGSVVEIARNRFQIPQSLPSSTSLAVWACPFNQFPLPALSLGVWITAMELPGSRRGVAQKAIEQANVILREFPRSAAARSKNKRKD